MAGFRLDAVPFYLDSDGEKPSSGDPHVHLRRLRGYLSRRRGDAVMLGEVNVPSKNLAEPTSAATTATSCTCRSPSR